jgi:hypothetical protein
VGFIAEFLKWLQALPLSVFIHKTAWAFTTVEVVHVFAIAFMIGTIMIVDTEFSRMLLPFTWVAFAIAVIAGALLFISRPMEYFGNPVFWTKMVLIVLAGINMAAFEFITVRGVNEWDLSATPPLAARLAGGISITCWLLVLFCGRLIGFTLQVE